MTPKAKYYETLANTMIKNFEKRRMEAYYCPTAKEAVEKALSFLPSGAVVAHGGSMIEIEGVNNISVVFLS